MKVRLISVALMGVLSLTACSAKNTANVGGAELQSSEQDKVERLTVAAGKKFEIKLDENASTGYNWEISKLDESYTKYLSKDFVANGPTGIVGNPGTIVFNLQAVKAGATVIELLYKRSWETVALKKMTYLITIEGGSSAPAEVIDLNKANLRCEMNRSQSLYLFTNDEKVVFSDFTGGNVEMKMESFSVLRCPGCYAFTGTVNGAKYVGSTHMDMASGKTMLSLTVDGKQTPPAECR